jgi:hypothetical protein
VFSRFFAIAAQWGYRDREVESGVTRCATDSRGLSCDREASGSQSVPRKQVVERVVVLTVLDPDRQLA